MPMPLTTAFEIPSAERAESIALRTAASSGAGPPARAFTWTSITGPKARPAAVGARVGAGVTDGAGLAGAGGRAVGVALGGGRGEAVGVCVAGISVGDATSEAGAAVGDGGVEGAKSRGSNRA
jgi:hypothetical protein